MTITESASSTVGNRYSTQTIRFFPTISFFFFLLDTFLGLIGRSFAARNIYFHQHIHTSSVVDNGTHWHKSDGFYPLVRVRRRQLLF